MMNKDRAAAAFDFRVAAAELARSRKQVEHRANSDESRLAAVQYAMSFSKGLEHSEETGLVAKASDFEAFRAAIDNGFAEPFTTRVPVPNEQDRRQWEAPTAGVIFELEGPDPQAVTMSPAPALSSAELDYEMAEVYELALLRDTPFSTFDTDGGADASALNDAIERLNALPYTKSGFPSRTRLTGDDGKLNRQTAFRGSSPGVELGPYISQLLLIGSRDQVGVNPEEGFISYGAQVVDQRVLEAECGDDYMIKWQDWMAVQRGYNVNGEGAGQEFTGKRRFITTPRDLATYVHFDALYQAYLNACLILLANRTPFDPAFDLLSGSNAHEVLINAASSEAVPVNAGGFALWGGPHILSLVTEVATRGLKAVRYQKFNNHLRLRPEALAGRIEKANAIDERYPASGNLFTRMKDELQDTLNAIRSYNACHKRGGAESDLLPMAFQEGSPMHPTYGAGHATVAGACVTMLKAFFDTSAVFAKIGGIAGFYGNRQIEEASNSESLEVEYGFYAADNKGTKLVFKPLTAKKMADGCSPLTLEGELNKLAANISIGRNMAGVHYFSDYYDSVRMGEEIALGILEEQALGYPTDAFVMSVPTFDGKNVRIGSR